MKIEDVSGNGVPKWQNGAQIEDARRLLKMLREPGNIIFTLRSFNFTLFYVNESM